MKEKAESHVAWWELSDGKNKRDKRWVEGGYILTELAVLYLREVMPLTRAVSISFSNRRSRGEKKKLCKVLEMVSDRSLHPGRSAMTYIKQQSL